MYVHGRRVHRNLKGKACVGQWGIFMSCLQQEYTECIPDAFLRHSIAA